MKMLANYMKIEDKNHDKIKRFPDYNEISDWARDAFEGNFEKDIFKERVKESLHQRII